MSVDEVSVPVESNGEIVTAFAPVAGGGGVIVAVCGASLDPPHPVSSTTARRGTDSA
jgi:hypothetical protein